MSGQGSQASPFNEHRNISKQRLIAANSPQPGLGTTRVATHFTRLAGWAGGAKNAAETSKD
jgi:hypothetical protein